jgi:chaperonin GroEL
MDEVSFALEEKKTVIPVLYRDCTVPFRLRRVQHVDFRQDYAGGLQVLLRILAPGQSPRHSKPPIPDVGSQGKVHVADSNSLENICARIARELEIKTGDAMGGATGTAIVLAQAIFREGAKAMAAGASPNALKRGIESAVRTICGYYRTRKDGTKERVKGEIDKISKPVQGSMFVQVGAVYSANDYGIGNIVAEALRKTGVDGFITVEESTRMEMALEVVEGTQFESGYLSSSFVTDPERNECVLEDPLIFISDKNIRSMKDLQPLLVEISRASVAQHLNRFMRTFGAGLTSLLCWGCEPTH